MGVFRMDTTVQIKLPDELAGAVIDLAREALQTALDEERHQQRIPPYMKAGEASEYLGISRSKFYSWVNTHGIPTVEIDGVKRYSKDTLDAFMKQHEH